jgi:hypothetical protein
MSVAVRLSAHDEVRSRRTVVEPVEIRSAPGLNYQLPITNYQNHETSLA